MTHGPYIDPRYKFAAERTMLAWVRTGLALMGFGFIMVEFSSRELSRLNSYTAEFGGAFILLGILIV
jgi:putative membrane protein